MKIRGLIVPLFVLLASQAAGQPAELALEAQTDGRTEALDVRITAEDLNAFGPVWWRQTFSKIGTDYIRFHMRAIGSTQTSAAVVKVEGLGKQSFSYDVAAIGEEGLWTGLLPGGRAVVSLLGETRPEDLVIEIDKVSYEAETGVPYSIWGGENETRHVHDEAVPELVHRLMTPIAKLVFQSGGLPKTCTGFLISEDTLLTNEHCINSAESCASLAVVFGYEFGPDNRIRFGEQFTCGGFEPDRSSFELDATLVRLNGSPGLTYGAVDLAGPEAEIAGPLIVIQHPGGEPKQVSFIACEAIQDLVDGRGTETDFTHTCDTAGGSSGAPVFDQEGRLVGLHHYGFAEGQIKKWSENRAVRFVRIRDWIAPSSEEDGARP
jgi:V8-like Glu-specific endopeptidase